MARTIRGWFTTPGRPGDRTLEEQLKGLDWLVANVKGKSVLDVGCAEGLLGMHLADQGAEFVLGAEVVGEHVTVGKKLIGTRAVDLVQLDANHYYPEPQSFDIVLLLAILHKLKDPSACARRFVKAARETVIIRLPPAMAPTVIDARSGDVPHDIGAVMREEGFMLKEVQRSHFDEWCGFYERI